MLMEEGPGVGSRVSSPTWAWHHLSPMGTANSPGLILALALWGVLPPWHRDSTPRAKVPLGACASHGESP